MEDISADGSQDRTAETDMLMWKKKNTRRQAVAEDAGEPLIWLQPDRLRFSLSILAFIVLLVALTRLPIATPSWLYGRAPVTIVSPVTFGVVNPAAYAAKRRHAMQATSPVLKLMNRGQVLTLIKTQLMNLPYDVAGVKTPAQMPAPLNKRFAGMTPAALTWLHGIIKQNQVPAYMTRLRLLDHLLQSHPVVDAKTWKLIARTAADEIVVPKGTKGNLGYRTLSMSRLRSLGPNGQGYRSLVERSFPEPMWSTLIAYLGSVGSPIYTLDAAATRRAQEASAAAVKKVITVIHRGQILAAAGEPIHAPARQAILAAYAAYRHKIQIAHPWAPLEGVLGLGAMASILGVLWGIFLFTRRDETRRRAAWFPSVLIIACLLIVRILLAVGLGDWIYLLGLAPILLGATVLVTVYGNRFAMGAAAFCIVIVTVMGGLQMSFLLTALVAAMVLIFSLEQIRTRTQVIRVGLLDAVAAGATLLAFGLTRSGGDRLLPLQWFWLHAEPSWLSPLLNIVMAAGAALLSISLLLVLLPAIERLFGITTAMTLLELSDTNRPLLRRLAIEAPGTFSHSLILGTLAEAAARSIGADPLLCRVGAYYHDIGKMLKPGYFVENTGNGGANRHEKLSPAMSLLIVVGHVKDGLELAREYHLPRRIGQFIAEHHGTTVVEYFYQAARQRQARDALVGAASTPIEDSQYRYPGPRPQSRETAILMICDGCESMVRSLSDPTPARIEGAVHDLIYRRLLDDQFSQSGLTLTDLNTIEQSLLRSLAGVHHPRIAYKTEVPALQRA
jgi:putative nucleotidyltransferase with HDIG domain